jgi:adenylate kinase
MEEFENYLEFEIPDFGEITPDGQRKLLERIVRTNGIWKINKNDPDDVFPSDLHADRVDEPEKLDLYTGEVYSKINKKYLYTLPKKVMKYIYNELMKCKEDSIKQKLIRRENDITYLKP